MKPLPNNFLDLTLTELVDNISSMTEKLPASDVKAQLKTLMDNTRERSQDVEGALAQANETLVEAASKVSAARHMQKMSKASSTGFSSGLREVFSAVAEIAGRRVADADLGSTLLSYADRAYVKTSAAEITISKAQSFSAPLKLVV